MNVNLLLTLTITTVLITGLAMPAFAMTSADRDGPLTAPQAITPPQPCVGGETDLLIQDIVPWFAGAGQDPRGAFVNELIAQQKKWCSIGSDQIGATNLSLFKVIILASDQPQTFYNNIMPGGVIHPAIDTWVKAGGVLSASMADQGFNGGNWTPLTFIGGVKHALAFSQTNTIVDASHPLITAAGLVCPSGNCAPIADNTGTCNDIDNCNWSNHGYFTSLPTGTNVIMTQPDDNADGADEPVVIQFSHGSGVVIANTLTDAWRYVGGPGVTNLKFIANDIAYQNGFKTGQIGGELLPIDSTALFISGLYGSIMWLAPVGAGIAGAGYYIVQRLYR